MKRNSAFTCSGSNKNKSSLANYLTAPDGNRAPFHHESRLRTNLPWKAVRISNAATVNLVHRTPYKSTSKLKTPQFSTLNFEWDSVNTNSCKMPTPVNHEWWTGERCPANVSHSVLHLPNMDTLHTSVLEKHTVCIKRALSRQPLTIGT